MDVPPRGIKAGRLALSSNQAREDLLISTAPWAKRSLGQNFLTDPNVSNKIVAALAAQPGEGVLEIGPGRGALTGPMCRAGLRVAAIEKDAELAGAVKRQWPVVDVMVMDALTFSWERLPTAWKVIGNLPYNVASPIIWEFVSRAPAGITAIFMVQKEVAQRIVSPPGSKAYGTLSVWVQTFAAARYLFAVGPNVFRPRPRVDSAVVELVVRKDRPPREQRVNLSRTVKWFFGQRRKQLGTILKSKGVTDWDNILEKLGINQQVRPECLSVDDFLNIASHVGSHFSP